MSERETDQTRPRCNEIWKIRADAATIDTILQFYCTLVLLCARITDIGIPIYIFTSKYFLAL